MCVCAHVWMDKWMFSHHSLYIHIHCILDILRLGEADQLQNSRKT